MSQSVSFSREAALKRGFTLTRSWDFGFPADADHPALSGVPAKEIETLNVPRSLVELQDILYCTENQSADPEVVMVQFLRNERRGAHLTYMLGEADIDFEVY